MVEFYICCIMDLCLILTAAAVVSAEREHHFIPDFLEECKYYQGSQVLEISFQKALTFLFQLNPYMK